ncbi:hypothetical protein BJ508DRAFT_342682 [Ascobolus immersus RN42]|uniref:Uncharacterized protein n=1 Tax=Ascobolus immersus RN42 TaxID=1160509 RepID=A0A3N4IBQ1_ASCIM|nr:hypothetical protein BJ508DRAFT_342682 [Ascobolus immersus RN42]
MRLWRGVQLNGQTELWGGSLMDLSAFCNIIGIVSLWNNAAHGKHRDNHWSNVTRPSLDDILQLSFIQIPHSSLPHCNACKPHRRSMYKHGTTGFQIIRWLITTAGTGSVKRQLPFLVPLIINYRGGTVRPICYVRRDTRPDWVSAISYKISPLRKGATKDLSLRLQLPNSLTTSSLAVDGVTECLWEYRLALKRTTPLVSTAQRLLVRSITQDKAHFFRFLVCNLRDRCELDSPALEVGYAKELTARKERPYFDLGSRAALHAESEYSLLCRSR